MSFQVAARAMLEFGAELISSDGIALYELIKNTYDAGSKRATLEYSTVLRHSRLRTALGRVERVRQAIEKKKDKPDERVLVRQLHDEVVAGLENTAADDAKEKFKTRIKSAKTLDTFEAALRDAFDDINVIEIIDTGEGMSSESLREAFLTIGTRSRLQRSTGPRQFVGGKGIGRLSAMRLGDRLTVTTTRAGASHWSILEIDWRRFSHSSDQKLDEIKFEVVRGPPKADKTEQGTKVTIRGVKSDWDRERVERIASREFDRLFDPFIDRTRYPLMIRVNGGRVAIPTFDRTIQSEAQAYCEIEYTVDEPTGPRLVLQMDYLVHGVSKTEVWDETDFLGLSAEEDFSAEAMTTLGPFSASFHWFNRQRLKAIDGWGDREKVRDMINHWAHGLLMYRDGFRVYPYGGPDDDWLGIDARALGSAGYKINRKQIIGAIRISASKNPMLIDQTNREGLRANDEKALLVILLKKAVTENLRNFLNGVDKEKKKKARLNAEETAAYLDDVSKKVRRTLAQIGPLVPRNRKKDVDFLSEVFAELQERLKTAKDAITTSEREQRDLVHLAGIGLLVEIVSHELGRVTRRTLDLIAGTDRKLVSKAVASTFDTVESQMLVIRRRLDMLDPLSPSGRQRKEAFDLRELVDEVLASHAEQFKRHKIKATVKLSSAKKQGVQVRAVKGMIVQVLENLIDNSIFWLKQSMRVDPSFSPTLTIELDSAGQELLFSDNGPGIPRARAEEVFRPFVSFKPPGLGKGLGLYISKEIARYHNSDLSLLDAPDKKGRLHTFVLDIDGLQT